MRQAISYIRFSTPEQSQGDSLRRQIARTKELCLKHNWTLIDDMRDIGISAYKGLNATEGAFAGFLQAIKDEKVKTNSVLIVECIDRISRQAPLKSVGLITDILNVGVDIATCSPERIYTKENANDIGTLLELVITLCLSHEESKKKSERVGHAWRQKKLNALLKPVTAQTPAWINKTANGELKLIPFAVKIVKRIFAMALSGIGTTAITKTFNKEGVKAIGKTKRSKNWHKSYITKILNNDAVIGYYHPHTGKGKDRKPDGNPKPNYYPAIIDEGDFYRVKDAMGKRRIAVGRQGKGIANLFTGLLRDGKDGATFTLVNKGQGLVSLVNSNAQRGNGQPYIGFPYAVFEDTFLNAVKELKPSDILPAPANANMVEDELEGETAKLNDLDRRITTIKKRLATDKDFDTLIDVLQDLDRQRKDTLAVVEILRGEVNKPKQDETLREGQRTIDLLQTAKGDERTALRLKLKHHLRNLITDMQGSIFTFDIDSGEGRKDRRIKRYRVMKTQIAFRNGQVGKTDDSTYRVRTIYCAVRFGGNQNSGQKVYTATYYSSKTLPKSVSETTDEELQLEVKGLWRFFKQST